MLSACSGMIAGCGKAGDSLRPEQQKSSGESDGKQLNIYSWPDYIHKDAIPEFEKRYGIKVVYDTVSSNEGLLAKFQAGASNYDIIVPSNYIVCKLKEQKLLQPLQKDRLSNFKYLMPRFADTPFDPHCEYSIPYTFGTTGIAYNSKAPCYEDGKFPDDFDSFWDERIARRMTLLEDVRETLGMALIRKGHSINTTDKATLEKACEDLKQQKHLTMCYTSDQVITSLISGDSWLSLAFSGDAQQAARENKDVKYTIPKSGASMWVDTLCIPKKAPHPENAHLWINFMLEPQVAAALSNFTVYATPNQEATKYVDQELLANKNIYPPEEVLSRLEAVQDIGSAIFIYDRLWTELKCV